MAARKENAEIESDAHTSIAKLFAGGLRRLSFVLGLKSSSMAFVDASEISLELYICEPNFKFQIEIFGCCRCNFEF